MPVPAVAPASRVTYPPLRSTVSQSSAERLIAEIRQMSPEDFTAALELARTSTPAEIVARQQAQRRERAVQAAARLRD